MLIVHEPSKRRRNVLYSAGRVTPGCPRGPWPPTFLRNKKKKENQMEQKVFKAEIIKRPSPTLKCFCLSPSRASRFQKFFLSVNYGDLQYFSVSHGPSSLKSILPALFRNYKYIPWKLV